MDIKNNTMKTHDLQTEVERTLGLLKQSPNRVSNEAFNKQLWSRIEAQQIADAFVNAGLYRYRKTAITLMISLNILIGLMLLYKGLTPSTTDRSTQLENLASEYSLVNDLYSYSTDNSK